MRCARSTKRSTATPGNLAARIEIGNLLLEKYNGTDARAEFETVLALNPRDPAALLGMARALDFVGQRGVLGRVRESLEIHPRYLPARVYLAELLVALERYDGAVSEAETALEQNPALLPALAVLAGARFLQGDDAGFAEAKRRALELSSAPAEFFTTLSELCVRNRLYAEAAGFAKRAVELDPRYSAGHASLGLNELRLGRIDAGRASLEASFSGDPYNVWVKNTLDLLDTFRGYRTERGDSFELFILEREAAVLTPYVEALASEALEELTGRYGFTPTLPIRIEVYSSHADFSVRTVGLAGLGALGVCFGNVLALDSPSARPVGAFNWGSTLWHELAHSITMGMTEHRVPRWLTEGISVYEERRARPGWGDDLSVQFLAAFKAEKLLPIAELNDGFVRPSNPQQVGLSYYQASLVVEMIERDHGFEALLALLEGYRMRHSTSRLFADVLGMDLEQFDALFEEYLRESFGEPLAAIHMREAPSRTPTRAQLVSDADERPDDFIAQLSAGAALFRAKEKARAQRYLERASRLFPGYAEADGPHWLLAQLHRDSGDVAEAIQSLERQVALNESHLEAHLLLAELLEQEDRGPRAAEVLEAAVYIDPFSAELHERIARLAEASGRPERAVLGRQTLVDLDPVDLPEAFYRLALAKRGVGDAAGARVAVLRALELAPRFQRAQQLLLELHRQGGGGSVVRRALALVLLGVLASADDLSRPPEVDYENPAYSGRFTFVRVRFNPSRWGAGNYQWGLDLKWNHDYPRAETHLMKILAETTSIDLNLEKTSILAVGDPELMRYPLAYLCEPGFLTLTDNEARSLREYLLKGGFLILDDFQGPHWYNAVEQLRRVLPSGSSSSWTALTPSSTPSSG